MANNFNLFIDQGTDFSTVIVISDDTGSARDLTGYTGRAKLKRSFDTEKNTSFEVNINNPTAGEIILSLSNQASSNIKYGRYVYDVEIVSNANIVERVIQGVVIIDPEVTR
jgi:hypothetical protein